MRTDGAFTLSAQNMAYENGSWWLPGVEVSGRSKTMCGWCGNYYYEDEAADHVCMQECEYCHQLVDYFSYYEHIQNVHSGNSDDKTYCAFCAKLLIGDEILTHDCQHVIVPGHQGGNTPGGGGNNSGNNITIIVSGGVPHSGDNPGNNRDSTEEPEEDNIEEDCDALPQSAEVKQEMRNILEQMGRSSHFTFGNDAHNEFCTFDEYFQQIADFPLVEHGGSFECIPGEATESGLAQYGLRFYEPGNENSVHSELFRTTIVNFHSHPQASLSAPSAQDLLVLANYGSDPTYTNYRGEIIVNCNENDTTLYFLMVNDRTKLKTLYDGLQGEIDVDTHLFTSGGICDRYLFEHFKELKCLTDNERLLMSLIMISEKYTKGNGLEVVKCHWKGLTNMDKVQMSVIGIKKETKKKGKVVITPIKC